MLKYHVLKSFWITRIPVQWELSLAFPSAADGAEQRVTAPFITAAFSEEMWEMVGVCAQGVTGTVTPCCPTDMSPEEGLSPAVSPEAGCPRPCLRGWLSPAVYPEAGCPQPCPWGGLSPAVSPEAGCPRPCPPGSAGGAGIVQRGAVPAGGAPCSAQPRRALVPEPWL